MDPISNADRLVLILREKLSEKARAGSTTRSAAKGRDAQKDVSEPGGTHALLGVEGVDDRQLRRAFVANILSEHFGRELVNDAQFQQVVSRVSEAIEGDQRAADLLSRAIADMRAQ